ncbi:hypothetical protein ACFL3M_01105 [Patescibacteria group bacterium]
MFWAQQESNLVQAEIVKLLNSPGKHTVYNREVFGGHVITIGLNDFKIVKRNFRILNQRTSEYVIESLDTTIKLCSVHSDEIFRSSSFCPQCGDQFNKSNTYSTCSKEKHKEYSLKNNFTYCPDCGNRTAGYLKIEQAEQGVYT